MANLYNSTEEGVDTTAVLSFPTGSLLLDFAIQRSVIEDCSAVAEYSSKVKAQESAVLEIQKLVGSMKSSEDTSNARVMLIAAIAQQVDDRSAVNNIG